MLFVHLHFTFHEIWCEHSVDAIPTIYFLIFYSIQAAAGTNEHHIVFNVES